MQTLVAVLIRVVLVGAGLVFAISLAVVATLVISLWGLRYAWARLTGRPVAPFVFRMDPRAGFGRVYRGRGVAPATEPTVRERRELADVTDVEPKAPRE